MYCTGKIDLIASFLKVTLVGKLLNCYGETDYSKEQHYPSAVYTLYIFRAQNLTSVVNC